MLWRRFCIAECRLGMDPDVVGISILGRAMSIESAERASGAAWAMDGQAISMPTTPGKRTAKLRTDLPPATGPLQMLGIGAFAAKPGDPRYTTIIFGTDGRLPTMEHSLCWANSGILHPWPNTKID